MRRPGHPKLAASLLLVLTLCLCDGLAAQELPLPGPAEEAEPSDDAPIAAEPPSPQSDEQIRSRIQDIYSHLEGLQSVRVAVDGGVVVLEGRVERQEARERAEELARRVAGTVVVVNKLRRDDSLASRLRATSRGLVGQLREFFGLLPLLLIALIVVGAAVILARLVGRAEGVFRRLSRNWFIRDLIRQVVQAVIVLAGIIIALQLLDAAALLGSIVGALGILGLAIGFATRDTVENYIASILLSLRQPFRRDEHIRIGDMEGIVMRLTPRATLLMQLDGNHLRIPNAQVFKAVIINYSRNPLRRFEFTVGVDTGLDLNGPRKLAVETLKKVPGVLGDPEPSCLLDTLGDSRVILRIMGWVDQRESDFAKVLSEAQQAVKGAYDAAGVAMPEPIYNLNLRRSAPGSAQPPKADMARAAVEPAEKTAVGDTSPDQAVDRQIRSEREHAAEEDLLDPAAPTE